MPFKQLSEPTSFSFEAVIYPDNIVLVGKIIGIARGLDPDVSVSVGVIKRQLRYTMIGQPIIEPQTYMEELSVVTLISNEPKVEAMIKAYTAPTEADVKEIIL